MDAEVFFDRVISLLILAILLYFTSLIIDPFLGIVIWGIILAIALTPLHDWFRERLGMGNGRAATALVLAGLLIVLVPGYLLGGAAVKTGYQFAAELEDGEVNLPDPPDNLRDWPFVGEPLYRRWSELSTDFDDVAARNPEQITALGAKVLGVAAGIAGALLSLAVSLIIGGVLLGYREGSTSFAEKLFTRIAPRHAERLLLLSQQTIRGVAFGVLGYGLVQATLVGLGLLIAGVPFAPLLALVCFGLNLMQIGSLPIVLVGIIYAWVNATVGPALLLTVYLVFIQSLEFWLKPVMIGRGVDVPLLVVFLGAVGGFSADGFLGLFTGAVILVYVYVLFQYWVNNPPAEPAHDETVSDR